MPIGVKHRLPLEAFHRLLGSEYGPAQGMVFPEVLGKYFVDQVVGIVLIHLDLFEDYSTFASYVLGIEHWMENQIAQNLKGDGNMFVEHFDVETDAFLGSEGIHVAADGIHLPGNLFGRAMFGPLEDHMLDEMRDAIPVRIFIAGTRLQPYSDGGAADVLHLLGDDDQAMRQDLAANIANFLDHIISESKANSYN